MTFSPDVYISSCLFVFLLLLVMNLSCALVEALSAGCTVNLTDWWQTVAVTPGEYAFLCCLPTEGPVELVRGENTFCLWPLWRQRLTALAEDGRDSLLYALFSLSRLCVLPFVPHPWAVYVCCNPEVCQLRPRGHLWPNELFKLTHKIFTITYPKAQLKKKVVRLIGLKKV